MSPPHYWKKAVKELSLRDPWSPRRPITNFEI